MTNQRQLPTEILLDILHLMPDSQKSHLCKQIPEIKRFSTAAYLVLFQDVVLLHKYMSERRISDNVHYMQINDGYNSLRARDTLDIDSFIAAVQACLSELAKTGASSLTIQFLFDTESTSVYHTFEIYRYLGPLLVEHPHTVEIVKYNIDVKSLTKDKDQKIGIFEYNLYTTMNYKDEITQINCAEVLFKLQTKTQRKAAESCFKAENNHFEDGETGFNRACMFLEPDLFIDAEDRLKFELICDASKSKLRAVDVVLINDNRVRCKSFHNDWSDKTLDFDTLFNPEPSSTDSAKKQSALSRFLPSSETIGNLLHQTYDMLKDPLQLIRKTSQFHIQHYLGFNSQQHHYHYLPEVAALHLQSTISVHDMTPEMTYKLLKFIKDSGDIESYKKCMLQYTQLRLQAVDFEVCDNSLVEFFEQCALAESEITPFMESPNFENLGLQLKKHQQFLDSQPSLINYSNEQRRIFKQHQHNIPHFALECDKAAEVYLHGYNNPIMNIYNDLKVEDYSEFEFYEIDPRISLRLDQDMFAMCKFHSDELVDSHGDVRPPEITKIRLLNDYSDHLVEKGHLPSVARGEFTVTSGLLRSEDLFARTLVGYDHFY